MEIMYCNIRVSCARIPTHALDTQPVVHPPCSPSLFTFLQIHAHHAGFQGGRRFPLLPFLPQVRYRLGRNLVPSPPGGRGLKSGVLLLPSPARPFSPAGHGELHLGGGHSGRSGLQVSRRCHSRWARAALGAKRGALHGAGETEAPRRRSLLRSRLWLAPSSRVRSRSRWQHVCMLGEGPAWGRAPHSLALPCRPCRSPGGALVLPPPPPLSPPRHALSSPRC